VPAGDDVPEDLEAREARYIADDQRKLEVHLQIRCT
jgi:hypothetical protein